jgi:hypothetical protein
LIITPIDLSQDKYLLDFDDDDRTFQLFFYGRRLKANVAEMYTFRDNGNFFPDMGSMFTVKASADEVPLINESLKVEFGEYRFECRVVREELVDSFKALWCMWILPMGVSADPSFTVDHSPCEA